MERYHTETEDGTYYLDGPDRRIAVGEFAAIVDDLGERYEIQYSEEQQAVPWLDLDEDGILTIDVRDTLLDISFDEEFADLVADAPLDEPATEGDLPARTALFTDLVRDIWETKGDPNEA